MIELAGIFIDRCDGGHTSHSRAPEQLDVLSAASGQPEGNLGFQKITDQFEKEASLLMAYVSP